MPPKKHINDKDYSQQIDESIAHAEERRKQALEEQKSLADRDLENISGGIRSEGCPKNGSIVC